MTPAEIQEEAQEVATFMQAQGDFYDNPLWTLNAFAFSGEGERDPFIAALPDKLIIGDGIIAAYDAIGLGDVGARVIMAHEFAHHVQYELGVFDTGPTDPARPRAAPSSWPTPWLLLRHPQEGPGPEQQAGRRRTAQLLHRRRLLVRRPRPPRDPATAPAGRGLGCGPGRGRQPPQRRAPCGELVELFEAALPGIISGSWSRPGTPPRSPCTAPGRPAGGGAARVAERLGNRGRRSSGSVRMATWSWSS